jgi:hypothetical protein
MPGELSNAGADLALNRVFRNTGTSPTALYLGLATAAINDSSTLSTISEVTDSGYSRQAVTFSAPADDGAGKRVVKNSADITFGPWAANQPSAITYCFVTDVQTGTSGTIWAWWQLDAQKTPAAGETLRFPANNLTMSLD